MKVCWFGIYEPEYSRNKVLLSGLRQANVEIIECNAISQKGFKKYFYLIRKLRLLKNDYDVIFCAFPINYNVIIAKLFQKKPIVIDAFFPLYDAYVHDRKSVHKWSLKALVYYWLDRINLYLVKLVITDTSQHRSYFNSLYKKAQIAVIPVGASTEEFYPINTPPTKQFVVSFHGSYIPLQGVEKIFGAAQLLKNEPDIFFRFIGPQRMFDDFKKEIEGLKNNIETISWLSTDILNKKLNEADVVLGIFGDTDKADRVVPNKVFQGIAVKKPVVTKDTPAIRELFTDEELFLVTNTPEAIAACILKIKKDYQSANAMAVKAYEKFMNCYTELNLGNLLKKYLYKLPRKNQ